MLFYWLRRYNFELFQMSTTLTLLWCRNNQSIGLLHPDSRQGEIEPEWRQADDLEPHAVNEASRFRPTRRWIMSSTLSAAVHLPPDKLSAADSMPTSVLLKQVIDLMARHTSRKCYSAPCMVAWWCMQLAAFNKEAFIIYITAIVKKAGLDTI